MIQGRDESFVTRGRWGEVRFACRLDGSLPVKEFLLGDCPQQEAPKLIALFKWISEEGYIPNPQKFKKIEGVIHEFKSGQVRISCYSTGRCWYLLHAFIKKQDAWPPSELQRAWNLLHEHMTLLGLSPGGDQK